MTKTNIFFLEAIFDSTLIKLTTKKTLRYGLNRNNLLQVMTRFDKTKLWL